MRAILLLTSLLLSSVCAQSLTRVQRKRPLMGTLFEVTTYSADPSSAELEIKAALDLAAAFAKRATDYEPTSELNQLTQSPLGIPVRVSPQLFEVLLLSQTLAEKTGGLFDPTYGPLTHLWRETRRTAALPSPTQLKAARARCGIKFLQFSPEVHSITVNRADMQLDLGGIAKGYAADLIFDHLHRKGLTHTLVAAAGDQRLGDPPPEREGWKVAIRTFSLKPETILTLKNCAISTSGDFYQRVVIDGQSYSHLIDPTTGLGLRARRAATVILPQTKFTDPLATVFCLTESPKELLQKFPAASVRIQSHDPKTPLLLTGIFLKKRISQ